MTSTQKPSRKEQLVEESRRRQVKEYARIMLEGKGVAVNIDAPSPAIDEKAFKKLEKETFGVARLRDAELISSPPQTERPHPAKDADKFTNDTVLIIATEDRTQVLSGPLRPCPVCGGELTGPTKVKQYCAEHPGYRSHPTCKCELPPIESVSQFEEQKLEPDYKDDTCDECGGVMSESHCYDDDDDLTDDQQAGYQEWIGQIRKNALEGWDESIQKIAREISSDPIARHTLQIFQRLDESKRTQLKGWLLAGGLDAKDLGSNSEVGDDGHETSG